MSVAFENNWVEKLRTTSESYLTKMKVNGVEKMIYKFVSQANREVFRARQVFKAWFLFINRVN